jgi:DNA-binding transcriptional MerR regulator
LFSNSGANIERAEIKMEQARPAKSPDAFRTISEAAAELDLPQHVLRFWEGKFPLIKPMKRAGGRRYYRRDDIELLCKLKILLHDEGYTIKGVQKMLRQNNGQFPEASMPPPPQAPSEHIKILPNTDHNRQDIQAAIAELETVRDKLRAARKSS